MVLGAGGGGVRGEGQIPRRGACNTQYPWIQLTVQQRSQERVSEGDRAAVSYLEPNVMACQSLPCVRACRKITKLKQ